MSLFGFRKYPTPVWKPMQPFVLAGIVTFYLVNNLQNAMVKSDEYKNDPRNPYAAQVQKESHH